MIVTGRNYRYHNPFAKRWKGICCTCRYVSRRCQQCPTCGNPLATLPYWKPDVPKITDDKGWKELTFTVTVGERYRYSRNDLFPKTDHSKIPKLKTYKGYK